MRSWTLFVLAARVPADATLVGRVARLEPARLRHIASIDGRGAPLGAFALLAGARLLATGGSDGAVKVWTLCAPRPVAELRGHCGKVVSLSFTADGRLLASGSIDKSVKIWDAARELERETVSAFGITHVPVRFSPDGKRLAWRLLRNGVGIRAVSGGPVLLLGGYEGDILSIAWSPEGARVAATSNRGELRVWSASTGRVLAAARPGHLVMSAA